MGCGVFNEGYVGYIFNLYFKFVWLILGILRIINSGKNFFSRVKREIDIL